MSVIRPFLEYLLHRHHAQGCKTEIRLLRVTSSGKRDSYSGYFDPEHLPDLLAALAPRPGGPATKLPHHQHPRDGEAFICYTMNGVLPEVASSRSVGRIVRAPAATADADIGAYSLFAVDIDASRPAGTSATVSEKAEAERVADRVTAWMQERGIRPIRVDSGNGYHLLVPLVPLVGPENVQKASQQASLTLRMLAEQFDTTGAQIDLSIFNPSRLLKLPGTMAIKGDSTPERPHRRSSVDLTELPSEVPFFELIREDLDEYTRKHSPTPKPRPAALRPLSHQEPADDAWQTWREEAVQALPLEAVYGPWLTGRQAGKGWLECRDPSSPSGDRNPSAGVADGSDGRPRGVFHSFRTGASISVFTFLIDHCGAPDFMAAASRVADLSGIPLPPFRPRPAETPEQILSRFTTEWAHLQDPDARSKLLVRTIESALELSLIAREELLQQLRSVAGLDAALMREHIREAKARRARKLRLERTRSTDLPPPSPGRTVVRYTTNRDGVAVVAGRLTDAMLALNRFFRHGNDFVFVSPDDRLTPVTEQNLPGLLSGYLEIAYLRACRDEEGDERIDFQSYGLLTRDLAATLLHDLNARYRFPELRRFSRTPLLDPDWRLIGTPGYYPSLQVYYAGPRVTASRPEKSRLDELLQLFALREARDRVNVIGMLLTAMSLSHWGPARAFMAISGNKTGAGADVLARVFSELIEGESPFTIGFSDDDIEMEKRIATRIDAGDRLLVVHHPTMDQPKARCFESQVLARVVKESRPWFRRLGVMQSIVRPENDLMLIVTATMAQLGTELRQHALSIRIDAPGRAVDLHQRLEEAVRYARKHREELLGELASMVETWVEQGRSMPERPAQHAAGWTWAATIDAILQANGRHGFLSNADDSTNEIDPDYDFMLTVAEMFAGSPAAHPAEWVKRLEQADLHDRFRDPRAGDRSERAKATIVGRLFSEYAGTRFTLEGCTIELVCERPNGPSHKAVYWFKCELHKAPEPERTLEPTVKHETPSQPAPPSGKVSLPQREPKQEPAEVDAETRSLPAETTRTVKSARPTVDGRWPDGHSPPVDERGAPDAQEREHDGT